jgi:DNA-binding MarR family transcriptional regulator
MALFHQRTFVVVLGIGLSLAVTQDVSAQRGRGGRGFFGVARIQLATLEKVQSELKLSDEQKKLAEEINQKLSQDRRDLFQGGGGDFAAMREKMEKLNTEASAAFAEKLDAAQRQRLTEIYVQANGTNALVDEEVAKSLKVTDEQKAALAKARDENRQAAREALRDFQDMSDEERQETLSKLRKEGDERMLAVLSAEQHEQFGKMKGKEVELDLSQLRGRGGRGRGGRPGA